MNEDTAALIELLRGTRRATLRLETARQVAMRRDPGAAPALLELIEESSDPRVVPVVTVALEGLQALGPEIAPHLLAILDDPADPRRHFMPLLLASSLGRAALPRLADALYDQQLEVRVNAATQLGAIRDRAAFEPLLALLEDTAQPTALRGVAAASLGSLKDRRALPVLASLAETADPELLAGAIDGLAELRDPAGIPYLEALLERPALDARTTMAVRLGLLAIERSLL